MSIMGTIFGVSKPKNVIVYGAHTINVEHNAAGTKLILGPYASEVATTAEGIATGVRVVVEAQAHAQQAEIDRDRAVEDAKRLLGI